MSSPVSHKEAHYVAFLGEVKIEVRKAKTHVSRAANRELIQLYWWLGKAITEKQEELGWGKSVVEQLAKDLQK